MREPPGTHPSTYLREALLEVVVKHVRLLGHNSQGDVIAHAKRALLAGGGHVSDLLWEEGNEEYEYPQ